MRSLLKVVFQSPIIGAELHCHPGLLFKPNGAAASTASTSSETRALALYSLRKSSPEPRRIRLGRLVCADPGAHEQRRQRRRHGWAHSRRHRRRAVPERMRLLNLATAEFVSRLAAVLAAKPVAIVPSEPAVPSRLCAK
jgi:hypothetical protein